MRIYFPLMIAMAGFAATASAIDLTPRYVFTTSDGVRSRRPCFIDGNKKYAVSIDSETELVPGERAAIFNFKKFQRAFMRLGESPVKQPPAFDSAGLPSYRKAAEMLLPEGAIHTVLASEDSEVLPINRWRSQRLTFDYDYTGVRMRESVIFLQLDPGTQIVIQIRAGAVDFEAVSSRGLSIVRRWHEVTPDLENGGN